MMDNPAFIDAEKAIFSVYGDRHQKLKCCEECAELIQAILKGDIKHIAEELADVLIMTGQLVHGLGLESLVDSMVRMKLMRQIARINASIASGGIDIPPEVVEALRTAYAGLREQTGCDPTDWD